MQTGTVKFFYREGWGMLTQDFDEPDVFVHYRQIVGDGYKMLEAGDRVQFDVVPGNAPGKIAAANVRKI